MTTAAPPPRADEYSLVEIDRILAGTVLLSPILDDRDVLLLAEGQTVTEPFLQKLRDRKVRAVRIHDSDFARLHADGIDLGRVGRPADAATDAPAEHGGFVTPLRNTQSDLLDAEVTLGRLQMPGQGTPLLSSIRRPAGAYDPAVQGQMVESYVRSAQKMSRVYERLAAGLSLDRGSMEEIASDAIAALTEDADLFSGIAANVADGGYPSRHSVHVAHLALSIATRLGLDVPTIRELVLGSLVHDAGMLRLDRAAYDSPEILGPIAFLEITKHPILIFDLLKDHGTLPKRSAFIAYQMHERCDGSGYPRRRSGLQIHFLSKVAAVADAYVALISPRQHRRAMMPYYAMERVVRDAGRGLFDRDAVRALLRTLSLFPIGSYVELSDGRRGRVLRAGEVYTRPTVEVATHAGTAPEVVDLAADTSLAIAKALPTLAP